MQKQTNKQPASHQEITSIPAPTANQQNTSTPPRNHQQFTACQHQQQTNKTPASQQEIISNSPHASTNSKPPNKPPPNHQKTISVAARATRGTPSEKRLPNKPHPSAGTWLLDPVSCSWAVFRAASSKLAGRGGVGRLPDAPQLYKTGGAFSVHETSLYPKCMESFLGWCTPPSHKGREPVHPSPACPLFEFGCAVPERTNELPSTITRSLWLRDVRGTLKKPQGPKQSLQWQRNGRKDLKHAVVVILVPLTTCCPLDPGQNVALSPSFGSSENLRRPKRWKPRSGVWSQQKLRGTHLAFKCWKPRSVSLSASQAQ